MTPMMDPSTSLSNYTFGNLDDLCRNYTTTTTTEIISTTVISHVALNSHERPPAVIGTEKFDF